MVQPALGPSLGVAPWKGGAGGWQADQTGRWSRSCQGPGGAHLGHVQVKVRRHQVLVAGVVLHQEGPGEGVGDAGALLHHVPQLACHLQAPVLVPMAVLLLWPSWRCLDEQRGASWRPVRRDHERWDSVDPEDSHCWAARGMCPCLQHFLPQLFPAQCPLTLHVSERPRHPHGHGALAVCPAPPHSLPAPDNILAWWLYSPNKHLASRASFLNTPHETTPNPCQPLTGQPLALKGRRDTGDAPCW